jgi:predicted transcriptional regulator of viral defense system
LTLLLENVNIYTNMTTLPKTLQKGPFTYKQALASGLNLRMVRNLVADGQCYTVAKGVYMPTRVEYNEINQFKAATLVVGQPSAICLVSALSVYGLTDVIPRKTWITVPAKKRTQISTLRVLRQSDPRWSIGIEAKDGYMVTSVERTLIESFRYRRMIGSNVAIEALREAIRTKRTTPSKVLDMAKKMKVVHLMLPYLEVMA